MVLELTCLATPVYNFVLPFFIFLLLRSDLERLIHIPVDCIYLQCTIFRTTCDLSVLCGLLSWSPG